MAWIKDAPRAGGRMAYEVCWMDHGRQRQKTCKTLPEAEREKVRIEDEIEAGLSTLHRVERRTVEQVWQACIEAGRPRLKPRTVECQESVYRNHIRKPFGRRKITSLSAEDVEKWVAKLSDKLSHGTLHNVFTILNKLCKYAVRHRWILNNPCAGVQLPEDHNEAKEPKFLTPAQVELLAGELAAVRGHYGLIVRLAAYTGLRAGELAALRVKDVDLLHGVLHVRRSASRKKGGGWQYLAPKSKGSVREVPVLLGSLRKELEEHMARIPGAGPDSPLWPGSRKARRGSVLDWSKEFDLNTIVRNFFRPAVARLGLPAGLRWHDLRHTYASIMAASGVVSIYELSKYMGHASIKTTEKTYTHLFPTDYSDKMAAFDAFAAGAGQTLGRVASVTALHA